MSALLMDVGNSRIKWGVLDGGEIRRTGHIARRRIAEQGLQVLTTRIPRRVDEVLVSNVAGTTFATRLSGVVGAHCECEVRFAHAAASGWGVTNAYRQPRRMGVDRWVALVGAWSELRSACLVVDAGTAITIDALDDAGHHLGGQIVAGMTMMMQALAASTDGIPEVGPITGRGSADVGIFGRTTAAAVREGARNAAAGSIDRALRVLRSGGGKPSVVLTGGDGSRILDALSEPPLHRPHLVLQGLAHMLDNPR